MTTLVWEDDALSDTDAITYQDSNHTKVTPFAGSDPTPFTELPFVTGAFVISTSELVLPAGAGICTEECILSGPLLTFPLLVLR